MTCKIVSEMTYDVSSGTLSLYTTTTTFLATTNKFTIDEDT